MTVTCDSQMLSVLETAAVDDFPYPHLIVPQMLAQGDAEAMLDWLETGATWWEQHRDFYTHYTCDNMMDCPLLADGRPISCEMRKRLAELLGRRFGLELEGSNVTLGAHRMHPGHGVGIHTDDPSLGTESLRLLVTLRRGEFSDASGGHLILFSAPEMSAVSSIMRPVHNSAISFPLSDRSYHAVNDVTDGVRYSLIFGFWEKKAATTIRRSDTPRASREDSELSALAGSEKLLRFLRENGSGGIGHSGATLMDHLIGVVALLVGWGAEDDVVRAGLFHSVYGTATFHPQMFTEHDRAKVQAVIGERAEYLAWLFSVVRFSEVYRFAGEEDYTARRRDATEPLTLTGQDVRDLNLIAFANMVEQLPVTGLTVGEICSWRSALERMRAHFPPRAVSALEEVFAEREPAA